MKTADEKVIEWTADLSLNIPPLDEQHRILIQMTNDLYTGCLYDTEITEAYFRTTARRTVEYIRRHFTTEESIMEASKYPLLASHRRHHAEYLRELSCLISKFDTGKKRVIPQFARFLRDHVTVHIAVKDKEYGLYYAERAEKGIALPLQYFKQPARPRIYQPSVVFSTIIM